MTCATCNKAAVPMVVATKTRNVGEYTIVEVQRRALVCDCGVLAWDPPQQQLVNPYALPLRPSYPEMYPLMPPQTVRPPDFAPTRPAITC